MIDEDLFLMNGTDTTTEKNGLEFSSDGKKAQNISSHEQHGQIHSFRLIFDLYRSRKRKLI